MIIVDSSDDPQIRIRALQAEDEKILALVKGIYNQSAGRLKILTIPYIARFESTEEMFTLCQEQLKSNDVELGMSCIRVLRYFDSQKESILGSVDISTVPAITR